jgi:hypothetical protein
MSDGPLVLLGAYVSVVAGLSGFGYDADTCHMHMQRAGYYNPV